MRSISFNSHQLSAKDRYYSVRPRGGVGVADTPLDTIMKKVLRAYLGLTRGVVYNGRC